MALIAILFASLAVVVTAQFPPGGGQGGFGGPPLAECMCTSTYTTCVRTAMQSAPAMNITEMDCVDQCLQGKLSAQGNQVQRCISAPRQTIMACIRAADAAGRSTGRLGCTNNPSTNTQRPQPPEPPETAYELALSASDKQAMHQCRQQCAMPDSGPPRPPQGMPGANGGGIQGGRPAGGPPGMGGPHADPMRTLVGCAMAEKERCRPSKPCEAEFRAADAQMCTCIKAIRSLGLANDIC